MRGQTVVCNAQSGVPRVRNSTAKARGPVARRYRQDAQTRQPALQQPMVQHVMLPEELKTAPLISEESIERLEAKLDSGASAAALARFQVALLSLRPDTWRDALEPTLAELAFNLESFNPTFTAVLLAVQRTIGVSDYVRRDEALRRLIVPLAGEYGMHNGKVQGKTHRKLFDDWVQSMIGRSASELIAAHPEPAASQLLFHEMMRDVSTGGTVPGCPLTQASYALGYNLAIEYMADIEKRGMLNSFRELDRRFMAAQGCEVDWLFLVVHAEDEMEHAELGHEAVRALVPQALEGTVERAMADHDRDFATFYNSLAANLESRL